MFVKRHFKILPFARALAVALLVAAAPASRAASQSAEQPAAAPRTIYVTVISEWGEFIRGPRPEAFAVSDGKRAAQIVSFDAADAPATIGILFDASASMRPRRGVNSKEKVRAALQTLFWSAKGTDEFFLVAFNDQPQLVLRDTSDTAAVLSAFDRVTEAKARGMTALYDAMYLALNHASNGRHQKRALVVFTDGYDSKSNFDYDSVRRALRESDVTVYMVNFTMSNTDIAMTSRTIAEEFAGLSGGRAYFPSTEKELADSVRRIAEELRSRYALGVVPAPASRKDNWHEIKVELLTRGRDEKGKAVKLYARTRKGFYWPEKGR